VVKPDGPPSHHDQPVSGPEPIDVLDADQSEISTGGRPAAHDELDRPVAGLGESHLVDDADLAAR
jgi:hypothetical protein